MVLDLIVALHPKAPEWWTPIQVTIATQVSFYAMAFDVLGRE